MKTLDRDVNPNVITQEINLPGMGRTLVADDLRDGYGDELSFGHLTQDAIGDLTGNNKLAVVAGEAARETWQDRSDLFFADYARRQAKKPPQPVVEIFPHTNGTDAFMVVCWWDSESEKRVAVVAHCWEIAGGDWDFEVVEKRVL